MRALVVPADPDAPIRDERVSNNLGILRALIGGGWLESVTGNDWCGLCDEEGKLKGLPLNVRATGMVWALYRLVGITFSDTLCGDVVFIGGEDGQDVPDHVVELATAIHEDVR